MLKLALLDLAKKTSVSRWYGQYLAALRWDRKRLVDYQNERLRKLIQHAFRDTGHYGNVMRLNKISPDQIVRREDLERLPPIDRDVIRDERNEFVSRDFKLKRLHKGSSSGTSGIPITYFQDGNGLSAGVAAGYALWHMSGWRPGQPHVHVWGNASSIQRWTRWSSRLKNALMRQLNIPSTLLDDPGNLEAIAKKIIQFDPVSIEGYPGAIFTLARYFQKMNYSLKSLRQVISTAENLEPPQKELVEKVFAPTSDFYGSGEVQGIAARPINDDKYYVFEPHVIVETVESGIPGMKDILITDLENYGMPMIRYKIGDMIDGLQPPEKDSPYPFAYFKKIGGRSSDIIRLPGGKRFHPVNIFGGTLFRQFPEIRRHKVIWNGTALTFVFEISVPLDARELQGKLSELLAIYQVPFSVEFTDKLLPSTSGKYRYLEIVKDVPGEP